MSCVQLSIYVTSLVALLYHSDLHDGAARLTGSLQVTSLHPGARLIGTDLYWYGYLQLLS